MVTCASLPLASLRVASLTCLTSPSGSSRNPYTRVKFAMCFILIAAMERENLRQQVLGAAPDGAGALCPATIDEGKHDGNSRHSDSGLRLRRPDCGDLRRARFFETACSGRP